MSEEIVERVAQLQHENSKLQAELNCLKEHILCVEEAFNVNCSDLSKERKRIKSLEQQVDSAYHILKDKDQLIESLENEKKKFQDLHTKVSTENSLLKDDLLQERLKNKQIEVLKNKEQNLEIAYAKVKQENQKLILELSVKSDECLSNAASVKDLLLQVKELQNEKAELMALRDTLLLQEKERLKSSENSECFFRKSLEWPKSQTNSFALQDVHSMTAPFNRETPQVTLRQEILEAELHEKQEKIAQLETSLRKKEEDELERSKLILELKKELFHLGLLNSNRKIDLRLDSSAFYNIYNILLKLIHWPEGQSAECKPLTDEAALSVVIKDGVQTTQPTSVRVIETTSIASQTDPIKNLSPVLLFRTFEKLQSNADSNQSRSDSDEEGEESLSFNEKNAMKKDFQLFSEPKNCDLDMDMYRSCRKLSVLPEEDIDESFNRKSSLKKPYSSVLNSCNSKTQSADDITKMAPHRPSLKAVSSCSNIIPTNGKLRDSSDALWEKRRPCNPKEGNKTLRNVKLDKKSDIELQTAVKSQKDAFHQPHSFDSYLDPMKSRTSHLPRQTSDPSQNTMVASPFARRESYIRRPKSTCRPLTLPCDKGDKKKEERICKVRFDLPGVVPKKDENFIEINISPGQVLNGTKKIKRISRFSVEIIDEVEFRKSLEESEKTAPATRKRPPLIHSVVYKKSVLKDLTNFSGRDEVDDGQEVNKFPAESPDSPVYDTAAEDSPVENLDIDYAESEFFSDPYPLKRRRQSDVSCYSFEDSQSSSEGNDILLKSIKLHTNSECIIMKELKKRASDSSCSNPDLEIPYIDAEDLPVIKPSPDIVKKIPICEILSTEKQPPPLVILSPSNLSEGSDSYFTPCEGTPVLESNESSTFGPPKSSGLSKSPTVLKNLANFELLAAISESRRPVQSEVIEEEKLEEKVPDGSEVEEKKGEDIIKESDSLKRTSSDASEASESDTLTYGTVKSHVAASSDCDSDTYVTVWSDKSFTLERKFSDLSENSSSPYNTPPDTSSASFCTPPDTYSPVLNSFKKQSSAYAENQQEPFSDNLNGALDFLSTTPPFRQPGKFLIENNSYFNRPDTETLKPTGHKTGTNPSVIFDSPKLEFYETNDSVENLEAFLQTEEGLIEDELSARLKYEKSEVENEALFFESEEFNEALSKRNSLESPKLLERRKKHPPLSRQNSTDEYNFLDPHDSCLNLSEEISSPSTTPDTSNKTVIFKNVPLTVSNTIDLEDDFPISETEIQVNFNGSQTEILEVPSREESIIRFTIDGHCLSEPCTPSVSSADFLEFSVPRKQRSSFTEESLRCGKFEVSLPEIIVSRLSSESDSSVSEVPGCAETDFASNVSDRSEVHLSDVNSISGHSDNSGSLSEHSDNLMSDVFSSGSDKSTGVSPEVTQNSSSSSSDKAPSIDNIVQEEHSSKSSVGAPVELRGADLEKTTEASCDEDMPMYKRSNSSVSDQLDNSSLDLSEDSSGSDVDSDNSRDFNLNSKKFTDCNLQGTERKNNNFNNSNNINNDEYEIHVRTESDCLNNEKNVKCEEREMVEKANSEVENTEGLRDFESSNNNVIEARKRSVPFTISSTPNPDSTESQAMCNIFSISPDGSSPESDNKDATFLVLKAALKQNACVAIEDITKKFQDLSFAFKTDSMTIQKRLQLMKRRRDQAESNIENELKIIKAKIKNLQYLTLNSEYMNLMSDLKKELDFLLNAILQLSSSAEGYGYAQHEERFLELLTVMLQHVENVESSKNGDSTGASDKVKEEREDNFLRRRSVAAITMEKNSRRRASIAALPRVCFSTENGNNNNNNNNNKGLQWTPSRPAGNAPKKLSFSQGSLKASSNNFTDDTKRDSICVRHRRESRSSESSMKNIDETPEPQSSSIESKIIEEPIVSLSNIEVSDSSLNLKQLFGSVEEIKRTSNAHEQITPSYCFRRVIEWNKLLINSTRFRWPENVLHYVPFYITWYVVFVLAFVFIGGLFTGINVCYTYSCLKYSALWFAAPAFFIFIRRFYRILLPLILALVILTVLLFTWLIKILLPRLTNEEVDTLFRSFGLEIRYLYGPPPI